MVMRLTRNKLALLAIIVGGAAAVAGTATVNGAFAAKGPAAHRNAVRRSARSAPRWPLSIFSHPATVRAHRADVGKASAPQGAILAGVSHVDGVADELYAWHRTPQEDCLVDVEGGSETTVACSPSYAAEAEGLSVVGTNSAATGTPGGVGVVAMVPDGVAKVEVTGADGSTDTVKVVNNVADDTTQADVQEYRYMLPDGKVVTRKGEVQHSAHE
jgi:hypothetical protein